MPTTPGAPPERISCPRRETARRISSGAALRTVAKRAVLPRRAWAAAMFRTPAGSAERKSHPAAPCTWRSMNPGQTYRPPASIALPDGGGAPPGGPA